MSDDSRLQALWALDEPPAHDAGFEFAVMERVLRRRAWTDIAALTPIVIGAGVVLWSLTPLALGSLDQFATADTETLVGLAVSLAIALAVFVVDMMRPGSA
jgi:hypothetical protein